MTNPDLREKKTHFWQSTFLTVIRITASRAAILRNAGECVWAAGHIRFTSKKKKELTR